MTDFINSDNVYNIQRQIQFKKSPEPYYSTKNQVTRVITDYDNFPYQRWYKGVYNSTVPIVAEREAGYRPRHDNCYKFSGNVEPVAYPNHCFEAPCSTVYPCNPVYLATRGTIGEQNVQIKDKCVIEYR
jgi:hypothetical protein|uniref:Uncharacterized protein n=1 Tax=viral metagenome TaxID=1070528 RepID=A0A6C0D0C5_9ZZZZ